jgi:predicted nucleic acid-binding protein
MPLPFLDTNIFLRHLIGEPEDQAQRATAYFEGLERGEAKALTTHAVMFEIVFTLERFYKKNKTEVRDLTLPFLELPTIQIEGKQSLRKIFALYVKKNISFVDAYHAVFMEKEGITEVISFDRDFDRIEGLTRREP